MRGSPRSPRSTGWLLPAPTPVGVRVPFMDPPSPPRCSAYDLPKGPPPPPGGVKLTVPVKPAYTSVNFYTRYYFAYYAIKRPRRRRLSTS